MEHLKVRYALKRHDGYWFHNPTETAPTEWSCTLNDAHLWVDRDACVAAAFIRGKLRSEEVSITELLLTKDGQRHQLSLAA